MPTAQTTPIPLGTAVIYYNKWTDFDSDEVRKHFKTLTAEEVEQVKAGDDFYVDVDPLHMHGKVYGRVKVRITHVRDIGGAFQWSFEGGGHGGCKRVDRSKGSYDFARVSDEAALAALIAREPLVTTIDPHARRTG